MYGDDGEALSTLDYARSKGIVTDHLQLDPLRLLAQIRESELTRISSKTGLDPILSGFETSSAAPPTKKIEKLQLDKEGARFLSSVLKEVSALQADTTFTPKGHDSFQFPKYNPMDDLKVDVPLLTSEKERAIKAFGKIPDPVAILNEIVPYLRDREQASLDEGLEFPDYFWELPSMFDRDPSTDKLDASRDTARLLQGAIGYLDEKRHNEEIEKLYNSSNIDNVLPFPQRPVSPLYIESEEQKEYSSSQVYHHSSDGGADVNENWGPDTEKARDSERNSHSPRETVRVDLTRSQEHSRIEAPQNISCHFESPGKSEYVKESVTKEALEQESHQGASQLVENNSMNDPTTSLPAINKARIYIKQALKRVNLSPPAEDFPVPVSTSLGTLSAFMLTRCQRTKRRRLDNESRYFSSPPKNNNKVDEASRTSVPERREESGKLPSLPSLTQHEVQNFHQYPRSMESITAPLTLILSTHLLRSESSLVRSLENMSSSRSMRLVFRDFTHSHSLKGATSNQSHVIEEADLIVSPTTGIILSSSHETTQKYLPGQGSPGIESPLKARIVRALPRYEKLYILIRSPAKMCTKTLSSIRELTAFCTSLSQVCTIKVLLAPSDHILEWILSIASKYTISQAPLLHEAEAETETTTSPCHEDQTQWEIFLRNAGLNPFAAQCVLGALKTHSMQFTNGDELNVLSKFVEMPSAMRREIFQGIVGERVLKRVEKALDMDWQVDWAVDLT